MVFSVITQSICLYKVIQVEVFSLMYIPILSSDLILGTQIFVRSFSAH